MMIGKESYGPALLRLTLGLLFIIPGIMKLLNPSTIIELLGKIGFPGAAFWGWLVLLSEIIFGIAVLIGFRIKYTVWPLALILVVAILTVHIPAMNGNPLNVVFHLLALASLISLSLTGPGTLAVSRD
mgnify:FL=1